MNCPNCGGLLDLKNRRCDYCETNFTETELFPEKVKAVQESELSDTEPQKPLNYTQQKKLELEKEKEYRKNHPAVDDSNDIGIGALVMGTFGLMARIRMFFRELKRVVCFIILIALEAGFGYVMISGVFSKLLETDVQNFVLQNGIILLNALLVGLICRIGRIRVGTALVGIVNFLAVVWVYIYPLIAVNFEGVSAQHVAILAVIEMAVIALSVLLAHLIFRR